MDINSLKKLLTECSVSELENHLEASILDCLEALNIKFTPSGLSTALITCYGYRFFYQKSLRKLLIKKLPKEDLRHLIKNFKLSNEILIIETKDEFIDLLNNFTWGNNAKSKILLDLLNLD